MQQPTPTRPDQGDKGLERAVDEITSDLLISESPEGPPPSKPVRRRSLAVLSLVAAAVVVGAIGLLVVGGLASFGLGLVLCAILILAGFPVWVSALLRRGERTRAHDEAEWLLHQFRRP